MKNLLFLTLLLLTGPLLAEVDFTKDIKPILEKHCTKCHGEEKDKGGLALHTKFHAFKETDSGEVPIISGKPEESLLFKKITETDEDEIMPPKGAMSKEKIDIIKQWISEGAKWPDDGHVEEVNWSLKPIVKSPLPQVKKSSWPLNEIDYFTLSKMEQNGFNPEKTADPSTLIRRVYLDLTGQLPNLEEINEFTQNPDYSNYEKIVDRLLKSDSYGEHWATHWLDLARYADSDGYQRDSFRQVWMFRDWVIKAINSDKPFDVFTIEQLAGDLLPNPTQDQLIATGFNRGSTVNMEAGTDVEHDRVKQVMERVDVMGTVWLGSSLACAQCHNHKYDPFSMKDYYSFMAYFNNTKIETKMGDKGRTIYYIGSNLKMYKNDGDESLLKQNQKEIKAIEKKYITAVTSLESPEKAPKKKMNMKQCRDLHKKKYSKNKKLNGIMAEWKKVNQNIKKHSPIQTRVMEEMEEKRETRVLLRGEHTNPGKKVSASVPDFLHSMPENAPDNRLGLAQWLVSKENPLMPRAVVNRWWAEFFGKGLSATLEDLGKQGEEPSHPELLDLLAKDFTSHWSRKAIHKKIVMSATYRQSSVIPQDKLQKDPGNHLYSFTSPLRIKAETIRDITLQLSGLLSAKKFGPTVKPPQPNGVWRVIGQVDNTYKVSSGEDRYRKGIYTIWRRSAHYPAFANFDAPDRGSCSVKRTRSNTPMQALTLMNDEAYVEAAQAFAKKIQNNSDAKTDEEKLKFAFKLCTSRMPDAREIDILSNILKREREDKNKKFDEWFTVATVLINMHETITRR
ncbi:MAG: PSD1 and planctomycete cytochrome C domain-containing protein [Lentisphaeraceae bacterium]|nr:PSD1 and planctomycete cytochrome C domain-containing protein [Lentisphaeraceae bacterium]